jgi:AcrR family transcriptional regulator
MTIAGRRERERAARRAAILASAAGLLRREPYDSVRVEDIAAEAEVAKGTVYLYFPDKDAILAELAASTLTAVSDRGRDVVAAVEGALLAPWDGLAQLLRAWTDAYQAAPWLFRTLVLDRPRLLADRLAGDAEASLLGPVEQVVQAGTHRRAWGRATDPRVVSRALWALFVGGLVLERRGEIDAADVRAEGMPALLALARGFLEPRGRPRAVGRGAASRRERPGGADGV